MFLFLYPAVNVLAPYVSENQKQNGMFSFFVVCHFCRPAFYLPHAYNDNAEKQQSCRQGCFHVLWNNHASPHWIPPLVLLLCWGTWKFLFFCFLKKNARSVTHNFVTKREDEEGSGINLKASCRSESCKNYIGAFSSTNMDTACWSMATSTSAWVIIMSYVQATGCWAAMIFITTKTPWHHTDMYTWEGGGLPPPKYYLYRRLMKAKNEVEQHGNKEWSFTLKFISGAPNLNSKSLAQNKLTTCVHM